MWLKGLLPKVVAYIRGSGHAVGPGYRVALQLLDQMRPQISACSKYRPLEGALQLFDGMQLHRLQPNVITIFAALR